MGNLLLEILSINLQYENSEEEEGKKEEKTKKFFYYIIICVQINEERLNRVSLIFKKKG